MAARLPAHVEVSGLIRAVDAAGGFATVVKRGDRDAGTILVVTREKETTMCLYERMPDLEGERPWTKTKTQDSENKREFDEYLIRRGERDADCWIVELDIANAERFIGLSGTGS